MKQYPRDMLGYGQTPPHPKWPENARIAVQFVINYEEGGENCILHGDSASEAFLSEIVGATPFVGARHMNMESLYEYGSRAGFWRLHRLFSSRNIPVTVFGVAMALERNPQAVEAMLKADWEIASHGYRWIDYKDIPEEIELEHITKAIEIHTRVTGSRPLGWYTGRTSVNTQSLVQEAGGFLYDADSYADDLPYWVETQLGKPHLVVPYTLDTNDMRFASPQGFNAGDQFFNYLRDAFDVLYTEGKTAPKMLSIGLHCRLVGRPGRTASLEKFLTHVQSHPNVWLCRRIDIAQHWHKHHRS
ncbi:MAG: allantoinase PuuE [SAR324 cluster bacterium]|nr:allantoinase PuuE [SAR324 cluster bacterium]MBL7034393.1 allantoinase PuuE [SAR324 cluster bacterium]